MLRPAAIAVVLVAMLALTMTSLCGCESCEFTYGALPVTGAASATVPIINLRVQTCESPQGTSCQDGYLTPLNEKQLPGRHRRQLRNAGARRADRDGRERWRVLPGARLSVGRSGRRKKERKIRPRYGE